MDWKSFFKRTALCVLIAAAITAIASGVMLFLGRNQPHPTDPLFWVGLLVLVIGCMMSMKGSPLGGGMAMLFSKSTPPGTVPIDPADTDRGSAAYHRRFYENSVVEFSFLRVAVMLSGAGMIAVCVIVSKMAG